MRLRGLRLTIVRHRPWYCGNHPQRSQRSLILSLQNGNGSSLQFSDPFLRQVEPTGDSFECMNIAIAQPIAKPEYLAFAVGEGLETLVDQFIDQFPSRLVERALCALTVVMHKLDVLGLTLNLDRWITRYSANVIRSRLARAL
jgi:hypothetical protein